VRTVIITGAGQGLGRAHALAFAAAGHHLLLNDLDPQRLEKVAAECAAAGSPALAAPGDIADWDFAAALVARALDATGRLDALVNNAGIQRVALPLDVTEEHWDAVMGVNAKSVYFCCVAVLRHMVAQHSGRVVNIASIAGKTASTINHPIYNVSKAAVIAMTKTLAMAHAADGVRVNAVCPGVIETPMQEVVDAEFARVTGRPAEAIRAERVGRIPMGAIGAAADVAGVVSFLIGPDARYMTGQAINVSGGLVMY
jgi:NAD(P)-dependent dehydrogenase (short-subunit alcohol dehydrogenase family)